MGLFTTPVNVFLCECRAYFPWSNCLHIENLKLLFWSFKTSSTTNCRFSLAFDHVAHTRVIEISTISQYYVLLPSLYNIINYIWAVLKHGIFSVLFNLRMWKLMLGIGIGEGLPMERRMEYWYKYQKGDNKWHWQIAVEATLIKVDG